MIPRNAFINKIRELGYVFKEQQRRTFLWRKKNSHRYIAIPKADLLDEEFVTTYLAREGLSSEEIQRFIGEARA
jgi:hypothetical protein